ncbi:MAG: hypothetical protein HKO67_10150, partial [Flavobacteriaceae bacterium]|nr:hypothetical protein [Flavobacteriaceae bacterium]
MKSFTNRIFDSKRYSNLAALWFLACFFCLNLTVHGQAVPLQTSVVADFEVDADAYSGIFELPDGTVTLTDDWLQGAAGMGVIDETSPENAATRAALLAGDNIQAEFRMSQPFGYLDGNFNRWLDAIYARDQHTKGGEMDLTVFGGGDDKNFDDPSTWSYKEGDTPQKNDIIDVYAHIRRSAGTQNLWVFFGATTRSPNGNNYLDFEVFRSDVEYDPVSESLINTGPNCGHTAYTFFPDGSPDQKGDLIFSANYTNGGAVADIRVYAWIDSFFVAALTGDPNVLTDEDFIAYNALGGLNSFTFGDALTGPINYEFYPCNNTNGEQYGYARIVPVSNVPGVPAIVAQDNTTGDVNAPSWKTIGTNGAVSDVYVAPTFAEFGINATLLGIDGTVTSGSCENILGSILVKSRSSTSFTSEL